MKKTACMQSEVQWCTDDDKYKHKEGAAIYGVTGNIKTRSVLGNTAGHERKNRGDRRGSPPIRSRGALPPPQTFIGEPFLF